MRNFRRCFDALYPDNSIGSHKCQICQMCLKTLKNKKIVLI